MKMYKLKYVILACFMLHNFCIHTNDPFNPHWKLSVKELELKVGNINGQQNKPESNEKTTKIANWLWQHAWTFLKQTTCSVAILLCFTHVVVWSSNPQYFEWFFLAREVQ